MLCLLKYSFAIHWFGQWICLLFLSFSVSSFHATQARIVHSQRDLGTEHKHKGGDQFTIESGRIVFFLSCFRYGKWWHSCWCSWVANTITVQPVSQSLSEQNRPRQTLSRTHIDCVLERDSGPENSSRIAGRNWQSVTIINWLWQIILSIAIGPERNGDREGGRKDSRLPVIAGLFWLVFENVICLLWLHHTHEPRTTSTTTTLPGKQWLPNHARIGSRPEER